MFETIRTAWRIKELRERILFTLAMFVVFRVGSVIPVPGVDASQLVKFFQEDTIFGFLNIIGGGNLENFTIFALGIMPYINASIIMQLLQIVIPKLKDWSQDPDGRKKISQLTRYGTVLISIIQGIGYSFMIAEAVPEKSFLSYFIIVISLTAGTSFLMWMGELITEKGIGNGISLLIFAGIIAGFPIGVITIVEQVRFGQVPFYLVPVTIVILLALIVAIVGMDQGQRRISVQYSKRVVGRRMYGGQATHIPLKVNMAGVIPVIFASVIITIPQSIFKFIDHPVTQKIASSLEWGTALNTVLYTLMIILFSYFYTAVQFDPFQVAGNIRKYGGFIPGLRPGRPTAEFLGRVISKLTTVGAFALAFIAVFPIIFKGLTGMNIIFTGTGLIIVVGVVLETMKQIESHMLMRSYRGFMK
ncbi:MAG TPA: preprotein translocase subunit SecY [Bacillota bacterium]|nr:preprotein translocase subunit SecY [Bacillota bacterium]HOA36134.1 preprotein translocase subunit SecY [Bacillota bacterium]HOJ84768.1 preprotein translocase subunit SecY [Bacillota bacterium]HOL15938.1 preprotein translocase subunit SecY [Bacillota bacterium]HPZ12153.1 preprotein translocase subunit SecY [Bacillota bacterium]